MHSYERRSAVTSLWFKPGTTDGDELVMVTLVSSDVFGHEL